jgi:hypothetical protein
MMHGREKTNKAERSAAESVEPRAETNAVVGRIFLQQENWRRAIWDFCNNIGTKRRRPRRRIRSAFGRAAEVHGRTASAVFEANDPQATLAVHCGNALDAISGPYQSTRLRR